jgi:hypothetical protein
MRLKERKCPDFSNRRTKAPMLHAYLDDSGTHDDSQLCVIAGYFGSDRQWILFDNKWRKILDAEGIQEFHANRFWSHLKGNDVSEYRGWSEARDSGLLTALLNVIEHSDRIFPVGCSIMQDEWNSLTRDERAYLTGGWYDETGRMVTSGAPKKAYFLAFLTAISTVLDYCNWGHLVNFSFDESRRFSAYAEQFFNEIKTWARDKKPELEKYKKMGNVFFPDSKTSTPTQAADLLAYQTYLYGLERLKAKLEVTDPNDILLRALTNIRSVQNDGKLFEKFGFDLMLEKFRSARSRSGKEM